MFDINRFYGKMAAVLSFTLHFREVKKMKPKATKIHTALLNRLRMIESMVGFSDGIPSALVVIVGGRFLGIKNISIALIFLRRQGWLIYDEKHNTYKTSPSAPTWSRIGEEPTDLPATEPKLLVANFKATHP
ncbi:MAG: hypothetical protein V1716_00940 [Candidatus Uhrbacteria bacterium]